MSGEKTESDQNQETHIFRHPLKSNHIGFPGEEFKDHFISKNPCNSGSVLDHGILGLFSRKMVFKMISRIIQHDGVIEGGNKHVSFQNSVCF